MGQGAAPRWPVLTWLHLNPYMDLQSRCAYGSLPLMEPAAVPASSRAHCVQQWAGPATCKGAQAKHRAPVCCRQVGSSPRVWLLVSVGASALSS